MQNLQTPNANDATPTSINQSQDRQTDRQRLTEEKKTNKKLLSLSVFVEIWLCLVEIYFIYFFIVCLFSSISIHIHNVINIINVMCKICKPQMQMMQHQHRSINHKTDRQTEINGRKKPNNEEKNEWCVMNDFWLWCGGWLSGICFVIWPWNCVNHAWLDLTFGLQEAR